MKLIRTLIGIGCLVVGCATDTETKPVTTTTIDGQPVSIFRLANAFGLEVHVAEYGATILSIETLDKHGKMGDVTLGYDAPEEYAKHPRYFGAVVGRYGNRIAKGRFTIDGKTYELARNNGPNHLHGGVKGFDKVIWKGEPFTHADSVGVVMRYTSPAGEEGYPGTLKASVTYTVTGDNKLIVDYEATTDAPTHVNLTQHTFFNLSGVGERGALDHRVMIHASYFLPTDSTSIPTGEIVPVQLTPFDLRASTLVWQRLNAKHPQLKMAKGFNHTFILDRHSAGLIDAGHISEESSGRKIDIFTTEPGVHFFTANGLDSTVVGKGARPYKPYDGLCFETQHYPDSPNHPDFPSTLLRPGQTYRSRTIFAFGVGPVTG